MAKQIGIIPISGTLDGINFYLRKGKPVARKAGGGFNGTKIKTSPTMVRVRENGSEFGHCSKVKKVFKDALFPFFVNYKDAGLHGKMMQLFLSIKDLDLISERGKRTVLRGLQSTEGKAMLEQFEFTTMIVPFTSAVYDSSQYKYDVTHFNTTNLHFPNGATHIEISFGVVVFDLEKLGATLYKSDVVLISKSSSIINFTLSPKILPTGEGKYIAVVSYRFVQEINSVIYKLNNANCFGIKVVNVD
jgi:hypothetical protein